MILTLPIDTHRPDSGKV